MRISDWSSDGCSADVRHDRRHRGDEDGMRGAKPRHRHGRGNLCAGAAGPEARRADAGAEGRGMIALDRRHAATIAEAVRAGRTSAVRWEEDTSEVNCLMGSPYAVVCLETQKEEGSVGELTCT